MLSWRKPDPDPADDGEDAEIVELHPVQGEIEVLEPDEIDDPGTELEPWQPRSALAARLGTVADRQIIPPRQHLVAALRYYGRDAARATGWFVTRPHRPLLHELRHVVRGVAVTWVAWRAWVTEAQWAEEISAMPKESASRGPAATKWAEARAGHRRLSAVLAAVALLALAISWWLIPSQLVDRWPIPEWVVSTSVVPDWLAAPWWIPDWMLAGLIVVAALFDLVGRRHPDLDAPPPPATRTPLMAGAPLGALTREVVERLQMEGLRVDPAGAMRVHEGCEYRIDLMHEDPIEQKHLRALERALAARPLSIRLINDGKDAGISQLRMQTRDPLAGVRVAEWIPTGSLSCLDYLPLGRSSGEQPCALRLAGVHTGIVGRTRAGKTESAIWTMIDRLAACRDAVIWGIDLQCGPAFPMWRKVIQEVAYTPEDAERLLLMVLDEIDRRMAVLVALAESDEDDNAGTTWTPDLGHYLFIFIDEFAITSAYNGEKDKKDEPNLMRLIEKVIRIGLKVGVHLVLASQKTGNSDFGSTIISSQVSTKILLACMEDDTVRMLSTTQRNQGWAPHLLQPFQSEEDPRDAGVAYIESPVHNLPERYKFDFWPKGEVKRRARQRLADGLPSLDDSASNVLLDAVEVPQILVSLKKTFARLGYPELAPTAEILADLGEGWNAVKLAEALEPYEMESKQKRLSPKTNPVRGYLRDDLDRALRSL